MNRPTDDDENAFSLDDADMFALLDQAAEQGNAATANLDDDNFDPLAALTGEQPTVQQTGTPQDIDEFEKLLQGSAASSAAEAYPQPLGSAAVTEPMEQPDFVTAPPPVEAIEEPVYEQAAVGPQVSEPEPTVEPIRAAEPEPESASAVPETTKVEDQIALARSILAAADIYRSFAPEMRGIIAQLISQDPNASTDEADVAIHAINADELIFSTMAALTEAKNREPVDRAFYILELEPAVRENLGDLVNAFADDNTRLEGDIESLSYARALVEAIDKLAPAAIQFVAATDKVLRAAKQR